MPIDERLTLEFLLKESPLALAIRGEGGTLEVVSGAFEKATGLGAGTKAPDWLDGPTADARAVQLGDRHFELWIRPVGCGHLAHLRERTEVVELEDQIWEQQTRLSKVYSELSVRNQVLTTTLAELRRRETELSSLNKNLEGKVAEQLEQLERSNKLRRYFSPEVANAICGTDASDLSPRKRLLTILFADVSLFDEVAAQMESEEIIEVLSDYHREMTKILFANAGTLDKFIASRIMGFFGDPVPQEDHAARAVRTALQMRDCLRQMRQKWFATAESVDLQVGIHTGYATVGNVGSEYRVDYTVIGKNVAMASALQQEAKPGQILMSARTADAIKGAFLVEGLQVVLKGSSRPVTAFNAVVEKGAFCPMPHTVIKTPDVRLLAAVQPPTAQAPVASLVGAKLGPYLVQEQLGEGGMGVVYKALDEGLQRTVALKVLASELAADAKFVARFKREARALASLSSPHIAQIYFISDQELPPFFAMELIEGPSLRQVLADQGKLPLRRALDLVTQMAQGLAVAAEKGVIHRDIKPDNVMLTLKGQVKLTDFGLAKTVQGDVGMTSRGIVLGTPLYMSPEQARGEDLDLRSDIYSLGATFFHLLAGQPPFRGDSAIVVLRKHEEERLPPLSTMPGTVSATVYDLIQRMMAKKREDRFVSYEVLLGAFEAC